MSKRNSYFSINNTSTDNNYDIHKFFLSVRYTEAKSQSTVFYSICPHLRDITISMCLQMGSANQNGVFASI